MISQLPSILPLLKCPTCGHPDLRAAKNRIVCPACDTPYAVINGIPDFAPHVRPDSVAGHIQQRYEHDIAKYEYQMRHWILPLLGSSVEEIIALVQGAAGGDGWLLDVPVGPGDLSFEVYQRQPRTRVVAVDLAWAMLYRAQERAQTLNLTNLTLIRADVAHLPFKDKVFDALLTLNGLHLFPDEAAALKNMQMSLKPGARLAGSCLVAGSPGITGWLMKTFQSVKNVRRITIESMTAQVQAYWPAAQIAHSGAVLTFTQNCSRSL